MDALAEKSKKDAPPLMSVHRVGKKYSRSLKRSLYYAVREIAREALLREEQSEGWTRKGEFWAVSDTSFELRPGDALALIGPNGAGKSTLLKMLCGLVKPDTGRIHVRGRTGAIIELGAGFDPVLSGRENIHISAAVLGLTRKQVGDLLPQIIAFSELEKFIDTPVKYYSSGMSARLSFSVAAHLNPDIFLVDEVLAVGDIDFQRKCIKHMLRYLANGGALILVSHSPYLIQSVCNRGIYINSGKVQYAGTAIDALNAYLKNPGKSSTDSPQASSVVLEGVARPQAGRALSASAPIALDEVRIGTDSGELLTTDAPARISLKLRSLTEQEIAWGFSIWTSDQWICVTGSANFNPHKIKAGEQTISCLLPKLPLMSGTYMLKIGVMDAASRQPVALFGWEDAPLAFKVQSPATFLNNALKSLNQLASIDVVWENPS